MMGRPPKARAAPSRCCACTGHRPMHLRTLSLDTMTSQRKAVLFHEWRVSGHASWRLNKNQNDFLRPQPEYCCCLCHPEDERGTRRPPPSLHENKRKRRPATTYALPHPCPQASAPTVAPERAGDVQSELDECVVCMEGRKEWVLFPCLHKALCGQCAKTLRLCELSGEELPFSACPVCRRALEEPYVLRASNCGKIQDTLTTNRIYDS